MISGRSKEFGEPKFSSPLAPRPPDAMNQTGGVASSLPQSLAQACEFHAPKLRPSGNKSHILVISGKWQRKERER